MAQRKLARLALKMADDVALDIDIQGRYTSSDVSDDSDESNDDLDASDVATI
jgi:hypothetical protein